MDSRWNIEGLYKDVTRGPATSDHFLGFRVLGLRLRF